MIKRVKICGITSKEDALFVANTGAMALGFIFYDKSPRNISPENAENIIKDLPPFISTVGVFVDMPLEELIEIAQMTKINTLQLHGNETPEYCKEIKDNISLKVIKALRVKNYESLKYIEKYKTNCDAILLDTYKKGLPGGTGEVFNWQIALEAKKFKVPVVLSGGLNPHNIVEACLKLKPFALDVNSGVEKAPGIKDHFLIQELFENLSKIN